jgi:hypothetical protein
MITPMIRIVKLSMLKDVNGKKLSNELTKAFNKNEAMKRKVGQHETKGKENSIKPTKAIVIGVKGKITTPQQMQTRNHQYKIFRALRSEDKKAIVKE